MTLDHRPTGTRKESRRQPGRPESARSVRLYVRHCRDSRQEMRLAKKLLVPRPKSRQRVLRSKPLSLESIHPADVLLKRPCQGSDKGECRIVRLKSRCTTGPFTGRSEARNLRGNGRLDGARIRPVPNGSGCRFVRTASGFSKCGIVESSQGRGRQL